MSGLRLKLLGFTLIISAGLILPLIILTLPAYNEFANHYLSGSGSPNNPIGSLSPTNVQSASLLLKQLVGLYVASLVIILASGTYMVNRLVINPVKSLTNTINQLVHGNFDIHLSVWQNDEIGELAQSYRALQSSLRTTMQRQEQESLALNQMLIDLQMSEVRAKGVFNSVQDGLIITDGLGIIKAANPAFCRLTGYRQEELLENSVEFLVPESYRSNHQQKIVDFTLDQTHPSRSDMQFEVLCKDGNLVQAEISLSQLITNDTLNVIAVIRDISERIKAEKALLYERDRTQNYLDTAEVAIISIDTVGLITLVNRKCCELLGYSESELLGMDYFSLCRDWAVVDEMHEAYHLHVTKNEIFPKFFYINLTTRSGQKKIFEWHNNTLKDSEQNTAGIILAGTDMTAYRKSIDERKALREHLHHAQKMQAVGQLSSGIAHDFNNILAIMMGYTELLQEMLSDCEDHSVLNYLKEIYVSGERARDLIDGMLKYSRSAGREAASPIVTLYIPGIAEDLSTMLHEILPDSIDISINIRQDTYPVMIDSINLQQVVMNLCLNASEAMQKKGNLFITSVNRPNYHDVCTACGKSFSGDFLELSFTDNGTGIDATTITHLFEPFYTTKSIGKGAGMGLAVVHGIVHDANGHISVESTPDAGSTFRVYLPATAEQAGDLEDLAVNVKNG